ncbi:phycobiliprotein lyase [Aphanothece hegewaldii CCALA 016]|uniref:Chromophore lyase CpcS/CpeS n=1 Tax=Aphanothece hegewaldii CCALA 016 TaxID=2107694 RepID=A0A2T1LZN7_9CHRO|nr:phycobiliprotein lyase [Aphanothece hegewaldii]PSF37873.1 phycobiliprotein lyase [Aphanothece hegewaldii CCALA 016]
MDIKEIIELCSGKWFSQRTSFQSKTESSKAEITVEFLASDHPEIVKLCEKSQIKPEMTLGGSKTSWDNSVDWGKPKQTGHTLIVWIPETNHTANGQILRYLSQGQIYTKGQYSLGKDEALTLSIDETNRHSEERISFASPNLRLRTNIVKLSDGTSQMAFYSEIRKVS